MKEICRSIARPLLALEPIHSCRRSIHRHHLPKSKPALARCSISSQFYGEGHWQRVQNQQAKGMGEEGSPRRIVRYIGVTYKKLPGNIKFGETNTSSKKLSRTVLDVIKRIPW